MTTESCYEQTLHTGYLDLPPTLDDSFHISMKKHTETEKYDDKWIDFIVKIKRIFFDKE